MSGLFARTYQFVPTDFTVVITITITITIIPPDPRATARVPNCASTLCSCIVSSVSVIHTFSGFHGHRYSLCIVYEKSAFILNRKLSDAETVTLVSIVRA
jgi:hypothetical protein